jgi:hypothetical protein
MRVSYGRRIHMGRLGKVENLPGTIAVIFVCILLTSCGGGGGGSKGNTSTGGAEQTPVVYTYDLNVLDDNTFTITYNIGSKPVDVSLGTLVPLSGTYETDTGTYTLNPSLLNVTTNLWSTSSQTQTYTIQVTSAIECVGGIITSQGEFKVIEIDSGATPSTVTVTVKDSNGVNISLNTESPVYFTWSDLDDLLGSDTAPTWQQQASLAASVINLILSQMVFSMDSILFIESNKETLAQNQTITTMGDAFSKNTHPGSPPGGIPDQGYSTLKWDDTNGDKAVGPGDDFELTYLWYWENDPSNTVDKLLFGSVSLDGFVEQDTTNNGNDVLTNTGFMPDQTNNKPGGVVYDNFYIYETIENPLGVFNINDAKTKTLNGGFSISFSEQTS